MPERKQTLRNVLQQELSSFTNDALHVQIDALFDFDTAQNWLITLLAGKDEDAAYLQNRIQMPRDRFFHVIATYLLGNAVRRQLSLGFDSLPRIFSSRTTLDGFGFFWAVTCLCHDLGYQYEEPANKAHYPEMLHQMSTSGGRRNLLGITYDMLTFTEDDIKSFSSELTEAEYQWILDSLRLVRSYETFRRKKYKKIDHGVAGGIILYDMLINLTSKNESPHQLFRGQTTAERAIFGEISANSGHTRFAACALLLACTVARHNIWTSHKTEDKALYAEYGLQELYFEEGKHPQVYVDFQKSTEQILFFLGVLDTIDPIKGLGLRPRIQEISFDTILDHVGITAQNTRLDGKYKTLGICIYNEDHVFCAQLLTSYIQGWASIPDWLDTKEPLLQTTKLSCYFPAIPQRKWPYAITEEEIRALCLYEGEIDGSRAERFWRTPNAYQTINLLMMDGLQGEEIRICREGQFPHGMYLENWKTTLDVLCNIYSAQLKCKTSWRSSLYFRVEREVNLNQILERNQTISFFSTCKDRYLKHLAEQKENLVLFEVEPRNGVPFVDYEKILGRNYLYLDEKEVLFPPFLSVALIPMDLEKGEKYPHGRNSEQPISIYRIILSPPQWQESAEDENFLAKYLENNKQKAAETLRTIRNNRSLENISADKLLLYANWKKAFQKMVYLRFKVMSEKNKH